MDNALVFLKWSIYRFMSFFKIVFIYHEHIIYVFDELGYAFLTDIKKD